MGDHGERPRMRKLFWESRDEDVYSPYEGKHVARRPARYLVPCARRLHDAVGVPNTPLLSELFEDAPRWPCEVSFKAWVGPQKKWDAWIDRLAGRYCAVWQKAGICDAIMSSRYIIRCDKDVVLGLLEHWCPETNTFVFPWGEATVTLEDVAIMGGFSPIGDPVTLPVPGELVRLVEEMNRVRTGLCKSSSKLAGHCPWLDHFMNNEPNSKLEHIGFLSLWLSRFVFCSSTSVTKEVLPLAVLLSYGYEVSLGPAVLASIYQSMRTLRDKAIASSDLIYASGPLRLVQLWGFERFPLLGPKLPNLLKPGEPRAARWHKRSSKIDLKLVKTILSQVTNFLWRPYAEILENWRHPSYYREHEKFFSSWWNLDEGISSFLLFLQPCELVGIGFTEKYRPHRVAMQFGLDQGLPGDCAFGGFGSEKVIFFVPPRSLQPGVSFLYLRWWRESMLTRKNAIKNSLVLNNPNHGSSLAVNDRTKFNESQYRSPLQLGPSSRVPVERNLMDKRVSQDGTFDASLRRSSKVSDSQALEKHGGEWSERNLSTIADRHPNSSKSIAREGRDVFRAPMNPSLNRVPSPKSQSRASEAISRRAMPEPHFQANSSNRSAETFHEHRPIRESQLERDLLGSRSITRAVPESYRTSNVREQGHGSNAFPRKSLEGTDEKYRSTSHGMGDSRRQGTISTHAAGSCSKRQFSPTSPEYHTPPRPEKPVHHSVSGGREDSMLLTDRLRHIQSTTEERTIAEDVPKSHSSRVRADSIRKRQFSPTSPEYHSPPRSGKPVHHSVSGGREDSMLLTNRLRHIQSTTEGRTSAKDVPKSSHSSRDRAGSIRNPDVSRSSAAISKQAKRKAEEGEAESEPKKEVRVELNRKGVRSLSLTIHLDDDMDEKDNTPIVFRRAE